MSIAIYFISIVICLQSLQAKELYLVNQVIPSIQKPQSQNANDNRAQALDRLSSLEFSDSEFNQEWIIQFKNPITNFDRQLLQKHEIEVFRYLPEDALLVRGKKNQLSPLKESLKILRILPYLSSFKVSPVLQMYLQGSPDASLSLLVLAVNDKAARRLRSLLMEDPFRATLLEKSHEVLLSGRSFAVRLAARHLLSLANLNGIEFIEPLGHLQFHDFRVSQMQRGPTIGDGALLKLTGYETGTRLMNFSAAWNQGFKGEGQIVGVADTGLDSGEWQTLNPVFAGAIHSASYYGIGATSWEDSAGHGTHVTGSIVARPFALAPLGPWGPLGPSSWTAGFLQGGAYKSQVIMQSIWSPLFETITLPTQINSLFQEAYKAGARIHSNSWGSEANISAYDSIAQQVDTFAWEHPDFLILFSAGNGASDANGDGVVDPGSVTSPATAKNALSVGASKNWVLVGGLQGRLSDLPEGSKLWPAEPLRSSRLSENPRGLAPFSGRGPTADGRRKPDLVAPGTNILSVRSARLPVFETLWGAGPEGTLFDGGASMSTPLVAAAAALAREMLIRRAGVANPSAALIKASLLHSALDLYPGQFGEGHAKQEIKVHRPNSEEGYGRVDLRSLVSLHFDRSAGGSRVIDSAGLGPGETQTYPVLLKQGKLAVHLVYTDAPGSPAAGRQLVNDLDLQIRGPKGEVLTRPDRLNPNEMFEADQLPPGPYQISILAYKLPVLRGAKLPYALIITAL